MQGTQVFYCQRNVFLDINEKNEGLINNSCDYIFQSYPAITYVHVNAE